MPKPTPTNPTGAGRPAATPETARKREIRILLTESEYEQVTAAAEGYPLAVWVRGAALREARKEQGR